ncbi:MAG: 3-deoxy-D-manno-octulosonic acid transferase [Negativicutes bacterium]|nr:3-deoxy-D-manno-octulosonic acid transferase [Negativicutes bacterium]
MKFLYNILTIFLVLAAIPVFIYRLFREDGFGQRLRQSFGFLPAEVLAPVAGKECIWLHAASVGEIVATSPIVKEIRRELPGIPILISVVTANGYAMAKRIISEADSVIFFPLDLPWLSRSVIARIKPRIFMLVETELWPNFLYSAREFAIPVVMVNGRISDKSVNRYRYLRSILQDMLATVGRFCMQSMIDAQYIIRLGAAPRRVFVTGNTKFDQTYTDVSDTEKEALVCELGFGSRWPILIAGSTHPGEEELVYAALNRVREVYPEACLLLAPREILRAAELTDLAAKFGLRAVRRTAADKATAGYDVVVLDTIGELGQIYSIGEIIFIGGSLVSHGGHNILEPAAHGKPIVVGPNMFNFKDTYALFSGRGACDTVYDGAELGEKLLYILGNDQVRAEMGAKAQAIISENRGAAQKSVQHLKQILGVSGS